MCAMSVKTKIFQSTAHRTSPKPPLFIPHVWLRVIVWPPHRNSLSRALLPCAPSTPHACSIVRPSDDKRFANRIDSRSFVEHCILSSLSTTCLIILAASTVTSTPHPRLVLPIRVPSTAALACACMTATGSSSVPYFPCTASMTNTV